MKRHELIDHLARLGCYPAREGGRHSIYTNPVNGAKAPVPRHGEIDNRLARRICNQLGSCAHPLIGKAGQRDWSWCTLVHSYGGRMGSS